MTLIICLFNLVQVCLAQGVRQIMVAGFLYISYYDEKKCHYSVQSDLRREQIVGIQSL